MTLHELLDWHYGSDGDTVLSALLHEGADPNARHGESGETPLHVAARRRRLSAVEMLVACGAEIDVRTAGGKTAYAHCVRRGFDEVAWALARLGADTNLTHPDRLAVAIVNGRMEEARGILEAEPGVARTGNPEEDRLVADVAGRPDTSSLQLLINSGADLSARGLDDGTPLHQAAWFGQPENARLLLEAGAPLEVFDSVHGSSPVGWAVHGSRFSGGAEERQEDYVAVVTLLLAAGSSLRYPGDPEGDAYLDRLRRDASPSVRRLLDAQAPS